MVFFKAPPMNEVAMGAYASLAACGPVDRAVNSASVAPALLSKINASTEVSHCPARSLILATTTLSGNPAEIILIRSSLALAAGAGVPACACE